MKDERGLEAIKELKRLKKGYCFETAKLDALKIKQAVRNKIISWDELKTTDEKIDLYVKEVQRREAIRYLGHLICDQDFGLQPAMHFAEVVIQATKDGVISLYELKITNKEIDQLLVQIKEKEKLRK
ncbi:MAG: hypothetical protein Q8N37_04775 [bacterium]|nr:hypothetical protein [bacterium]